MNFKTSVSYFIRNLREKHRLSIRNQHNDSEVWYMYISPLNLLAGFLALVLILFIVITITVAYTPVLDLIPGYPGNKSRTMLIENIIRLDSLEQEVRNMQIYSDNIALIMAGKNPVTRNNVQNSDSLSKKNAAAAATIVEDSLLRRQMETPGGIYSLNDRTRRARTCVARWSSIRRSKESSPKNSSDRQPVRNDARHRRQPAGDGGDGRNGRLVVMDARRRLRAVHPARRQYAIGLPA